MVTWETSKEDEEKFVKKAYELISKYEMEVPAVLLLESIKPLVWVGGGLLRIAVSPFLIFSWNEGHAFIDTFEKRKNIEKLIKMLEEKQKKDNKNEDKTTKENKNSKVAKKGWRKFFRL